MADSDESKWFLEKYCSTCNHYDPKSGLCSEIHYNVKEYPAKFLSKCGGTYFSGDKSKVPKFMDAVIKNSQSKKKIIKYNIVTVEEVEQMILDHKNEIQKGKITMGLGCEKKMKTSYHGSGTDIYKRTLFQTEIAPFTFDIKPINGEETYVREEECPTCGHVQGFDVKRHGVKPEVKLKSGYQMWGKHEVVRWPLIFDKISANIDMVRGQSIIAFVFGVILAVGLGIALTLNGPARFSNWIISFLIGGVLMGLGVYMRFFPIKWAIWHLEIQERDKSKIP